MVTYYVDGTNGNDANNGITPATPIKTQAAAAIAALASGDTVLFWGRMDTTWIFTGLTNLTLRAWTQADNVAAGFPNTLLASPTNGENWPLFYGGVDMAQTGWTPDATITTGGYLGIGTGKDFSLSAVWRDVATRKDATTGLGYGKLRWYDTLANWRTAATGAAEVAFYDTSNGRLYVYVNGVDLNTATARITYVNQSGIDTNTNGNSAIVLNTGCDSAVVSGLNFDLYSTSKYKCNGTPGTTRVASQDGWAIQVTGSKNVYLAMCKADRMGAHAFGCLGNGADCSGYLDSGCSVGSLREDGNHYVTYQTAAVGALQAGTQSCTAYPTRWMGATYGTAQGGLDANTQICFYAHADSGTPIANILHDAPNIINVGTESGWVPWAVANQVAVATGSWWNWNAFSFRVDRATVTNHYSIVWGNVTIATRRTRFIQKVNTAPVDVGGNAIFDFQANAQNCLLWDSVEFITDQSDRNASPGTDLVKCFRVFNAGTIEQRFINPSGYDRSTEVPTNFHAWFDYNSLDQASFRVRGGVFVRSTTGSASAACINDSGTSIANHDFLDTPFQGINDGSGRWSQLSTINDSTKWRQNVDTANSAAVLVPAGTVFPNAPTNLGLTTASAIWGNRRSTTTVRISSTGINLIGDNGFFGASQYSAADTLGGPGSGRSGFGNRGAGDAQRLFMRGR